MTGCTVSRALWTAKKAEADKKKKDESSGSGENAGSDSVSDVGGGGLAQRLPILLLLPLLRSQATASLELREEIASVLFSSLLEAEDQRSLAPQCLKELAGLLSAWLEESSSPKVAAALVSVSISKPVCPATLTFCIHLLNRIKLPSLPVASLLQRLANRTDEQAPSHDQSEEDCSLEAIKDSLLLYLGHLATLTVMNQNRPRLQRVPGHMDRVLDLLQDALERGAQSSVLALIQQLQADLASDEEVSPRLKSVLWPLLESQDTSIIEATSFTLLVAVPRLWQSWSEQANLALHLLQQSECLGKSRLLDLLLSEWSVSLNSGKTTWREQVLEETLLSFASSSDVETIKKLASTPPQTDGMRNPEGEITASSLANTGRASCSKLRYMAALQGHLMRTLILQEKIESKCRMMSSLNTNRSEDEDDAVAWSWSWCDMVLMRSNAVLREAQELVVERPEAKEEVEQVFRTGFLGEITLPLVTVLAAVEEVEMCKRLVKPIVSLLIQAQRLLDAAKDPAAEDLQESLKTCGSTDSCVNIILDMALTLASVVSAWLKILHMPSPSGGNEEPDFLVLLEKTTEPSHELTKDEVGDQWKVPFLRPSLQELLQVERLLQGLERAVKGLGKKALADASSRFSVLVRSLQAGAELEGRWEEALDDIRGGVATPILAEMSGDGDLRKLCDLLFGKEWIKRDADIKERLAIHLEKEAEEPRSGNSRLPRTDSLVAGILRKLDLVEHGALARIAKDTQWIRETDNPLTENTKDGSGQPSEEVEETKLVALLFSLLESPYSSDDLTKLLKKRAQRGQNRNAALVQTSRLAQVGFPLPFVEIHLSLPVTRHDRDRCHGSGQRSRFRSTGQRWQAPGGEQLGSGPVKPCGAGERVLASVYSSFKGPGQGPGPCCGSCHCHPLQYAMLPSG